MSANPYAGVVAIDGPSASGKTTVARVVSEKLGSTVFDTGALYRAVTLESIRRGVSPSDGAALEHLVATMAIDVSESGNVRVNGEDVSAELRTAAVDRWVSEVSAHPEVREALLPVQRAVGHGRRVVMVGRDIATVVIPEAGLKVYLDATVEERARRRFADQQAAGGSLTYDDVRSEIERRDAFDSSRETSPLKQHKDALVVHTDSMTVDEVAETIATASRSKTGKTEVPVLVRAPFTVKTRPEYFRSECPAAQTGQARLLADLAVAEPRHAPDPGGHREYPSVRSAALCFESSAQSRSGPGVLLLYPPAELHGQTGAFRHSGRQADIRRVRWIPGGPWQIRSRGAAPGRRAIGEGSDRWDLRGGYPESDGCAGRSESRCRLLALKTGALVLPVAITGSERRCRSTAPKATPRAHTKPWMPGLVSTSSMASRSTCHAPSTARNFRPPTRPTSSCWRSPGCCRRATAGSTLRSWPSRTQRLIIPYSSSSSPSSSS